MNHRQNFIRDKHIRIIMSKEREKSSTISARFPISAIQVLKEVVVDELRLGGSIGEAVKNIVLKWLYENEQIDESLVPAIMLYYDKSKDKKYYTPDEIIEEIEKLKPGETLRGIAIKRSD